MSFLACKFNLNTINDKLVVSSGGSFLKYGEAHVLTNGFARIDSQDLGQSVYFLLVTVCGEDNFGLEVINPIARITTESMKSIHYDVTVPRIRSCKKGEIIRKEEGGDFGS